MEKIVVTGATGLLGSAVVSNALQQGTFEIHVVSSSSAEKSLFPHVHFPSVYNYAEHDLNDYDEINSLIATITPKFIIHCAALSSPLLCEKNPEIAWSTNAECCATLARVAKNCGAFLVGVSTDLVFEGADPELAPFDENASPAPVSVYARSKRAGEEHILGLDSKGSVVRVSLLLGHTRSSSKGHLGWLEDHLSRKSEVQLFTDEIRTPIWIEDAARFLLEIGTRTLSGIYHLGTRERLSRAELGEIVASGLGYDLSLIRKVTRAEVSGSAHRAADVSLDASKFHQATGLSPTPICDVFSKLDKGRLQIRTNTH